MNINVPFLREVDVLIFGGTTGAVAAAAAVRRAGKSVLCATPFTYPGEDVCSVMNYWHWGASGEKPLLLPEIFGRDFFSLPAPAPMLVKFGLEQLMIEEGVEFLYMVHPFCCLRDKNGRVVGAVIADRSGFQAIKAEVIIDAGERALFARTLREAEFRPFAAGEYPMRRVTACREESSGEAIDEDFSGGTPLPGRFQAGEMVLKPYVWEFSPHLNDATPETLARLDLESRLRTWSPGQMISADRLDIKFADCLLSDDHHQALWTGANNLSLTSLHCSPAPVFVLGPLADISDSVAARLRDPCALMTVGFRLGELAAEMVAWEGIGEVRVDQETTSVENGLEVVRMDSWFRMEDQSGVELELNRVPVLGEFDVVVAGGGTAGAPAGIAAGRAGVKTLILEYLSGLGGMGTEGRIASYYHGNLCGFTSEIDQGVRALGVEPELIDKPGRWNTEKKKHWFLRTADEADVKVWFGAMIIAGALDGKRVSGVLAATPYGCGLVKADKVVDASGNADVAAAAGCATLPITTNHLAVQGTGLSPNVPGEHYANSDYTFVDDNDLMDVTRAFAVARKKFSACFDVAQIVESRERRQIEGKLMLEPLDFLARRTFQDTITTAASNFDSHGFTIHPVFLAKPPDREELRVHVPFRCLLPLDREGILVTGLAISCHRDSLPVVRMQADVQNQGYGAGRAAALAVQCRCDLRKIDIKALQRHLADVGVLEKEVVKHHDTPPLSDADFTWAVESGKDDYLGLAIIFSDPRRSRSLLQKACRNAQVRTEKVRCALLLGLLGDDTGLDALLEQTGAGDWDQGWHYTGMGQFGYSMSEMDSLVVALGRSKNPRALPVILEKMRQLSPESEFSHCRAVAMALEEQPTAQAAEPLAVLLRQLSGHSCSELAVFVDRSSSDPCDTVERNRELKELVIARALLVCGDREGLAARVLAGYADDLHGHYARHARALLHQYIDSREKPR